MADIKFQCPECAQKIAVDDSAASLQIDCPSCRSAIIIPAQSGENVVLVTRRQAADAAGAGSAVEELGRLQRELTAALEQAATLRAESERGKAEAERLRDELATAGRAQTEAQTAGAELSRLQAEEGRLQAELAKAQEEARAAGEALGRLQAEDARGQAEVAKFQGEAQAATAELSRLQEEEARAQAELAKAREELQRERKEREGLAQRLGTHEAAASAGAAAEAETASLKEQLNRLSGERDALTTRLAEAAAERDRLQSELAVAGAEAEKLRAELAEAREAFENERARAGKIAASVAAVEREREELREHLIAAGENHPNTPDAQTETAKLQGELDATVKALETAKAESGQAAQNLAELRQRLENAGVSRDEALKLAADREAALQQLQQELAAAPAPAGDQPAPTEDPAARNAALRAAEEQLGEAREQEKVLLRRLEDADKVLAAAQEKSRSLAGECDRLSANLTRVNTELSVATEQLRQARSEREVVRPAGDSAGLEPGPGLDRLRAVEAERDAFHAELEAVKAGLERTKQHVHQLQERRDQMRDEIARLKVALGQAPDAIG